MRTYLSIALTIMISLLSVGHASAQQAKGEAPNEKVSACIVFAHPTAELAANASEPAQCFESIEKVEEHMSRQRTGSNLLGVLYEHSNKTGSSISMYAGTGIDCTNAYIGSLASHGFDNITTSLDNGCNKIWLWDGYSQTGTNNNYGNGVTNWVGSMNDLTSSVSFHN